MSVYALHPLSGLLPGVVSEVRGDCVSPVSQPGSPLLPSPETDELGLPAHLVLQVVGCPRLCHWPLGQDTCMSAALVPEGRVRVASPRPVWQAGAPQHSLPCTPGYGTPARGPPGWSPGRSCQQILRKCSRFWGAVGKRGKGQEAWPVQSWDAFPLLLGLCTVGSEVPVPHTAPNTCPPLRSRPFHVSAPGVLSP